MALGASRHFVHIVSCSDGTLYVGSTSDVLERGRVHNEGRGPRYTAARLPVRVVYSEGHESRSSARQREVQLKRWSHVKKQALADGHLNRLHRLARRHQCGIKLNGSGPRPASANPNSGAGHRQPRRRSSRLARGVRLRRSCGTCVPEAGSGRRPT